jgi:hypothetical protein
LSLTAATGPFEKHYNRYLTERDAYLVNGSVAPEPISSDILIMMRTIRLNRWTLMGLMLSQQPPPKPSKLRPWDYDSPCTADVAA